MAEFKAQSARSFTADLIRLGVEQKRFVDFHMTCASHVVWCEGWDL